MAETDTGQGVGRWHGACNRNEQGGALACLVCHTEHKFLHENKLCNKCSDILWKMRRSGFSSEQLELLIYML